jgi:hypothetical protein
MIKKSLKSKRSKSHTWAPFFKQLLWILNKSSTVGIVELWRGSHKDNFDESLDILSAVESQTWISFRSWIFKSIGLAMDFFPSAEKGGVETFGQACLLRLVHTLHRACIITWYILPPICFQRMSLIKHHLIKVIYLNKSKWNFDEIDTRQLKILIKIQTWLWILKIP